MIRTFNRRMIHIKFAKFVKTYFTQALYYEYEYYNKAYCYNRLYYEKQLNRIFKINNKLNKNLHILDSRFKNVQ